nr:Chain A, RR14 [Illicium verum]8GVN_A Chain A, TRP-LEU-ARG-ARG-ILE-LYS-ALA-TRP-LEU-ARG-ARG-ILE-LYS-ALA [Illicium anisatum]
WLRRIKAWLRRIKA